MRAEEGSISRILSQLGRFELIGTAAFTRALLGLFPFGLSHDL